MELQTPIILPETDIKLDTSSSMMLIGSCFAENVGAKLQQYMGTDNVDVNPFGVLYNPVSIAQAIEILASPNLSQGEELLNSSIFLGQDGVWHSWLFTSHFSAQTKEECLSKIKDRLATARENLRKVDLLCITFGTTRCYQLTTPSHLGEGWEEGRIVANCHKEPQRLFTENESTLEELIIMWQDVINKLREYNPTLRICFTVSPYRYRKYGFHESQIQKAKLLLLVDSLLKLPSFGRDGERLYFPSYEIMMDELRDYRFYANDMLHPSDLAVDIITQRFIDWTFTPELKELAKENLKAYKRSQHRPITQ